MLNCQQGRAVGKTQWNRWLSKGPGWEGEELDDEVDMFLYQKGGSKTRMFAPHDLGRNEREAAREPVGSHHATQSFLEVSPLFVLLEYGLGVL